ncbi:hypothetical protein VK70_14495 [Paenibacillus durus ATCC 35681]|uniref:Uncharacterized protein n=1 Tax=Paenibacillus durus ATCC 35681 TaxID=1333534 RepID=A0A0F7FAK6_PAEDU|nr:hypothetical protein VK70_14495 [Paenibacillus durus ATCC 35681]
MTCRIRAGYIYSSKDKKYQSKEMIKVCKPADGYDPRVGTAIYILSMSLLNRFIFHRLACITIFFSAGDKIRRALYLGKSLL